MIRYHVLLRRLLVFGILPQGYKWPWLSIEAWNGSCLVFRKRVQLDHCTSSTIEYGPQYAWTINLFFNFRMELFWFSFLSQVLKLYAWEESFLSKITRIRNNELKYLRNASCFNAIIEFTFTCAPFLVSLWVDKHKYRKNKYENDERKPSDTWVYPNLDLHTHLQGRGRWVDGGRRIDNLVYPLQLI